MICRKRSYAIRVSLFCALGATAIQLASAQSSYPSRSPTIIVPFAAGGGTDLLARFWGGALQKELGQSFIIDVRAGAGGVIGTRQAAQAQPDGYTLLIATPAFALNPFLVKDVGYDPVTSFQALAITGISPIAVVVPLDSTIKTVRDIIERSRANPGVFNVGNAGQGSGGQMAAAAFQAHTGVKFTEIPYKGAAPALVDLIGGRTQLQFEAFPSALPGIKAGKIRVIAVTPRKRSGLLPDTPTADESGAPGYEYSSWTGFMAPAKTPRPIVDRLNAAFRKALVDPAIIKGLADSFGSDPGSGTPEEATAFVAAQYKENERLTRMIGITPQ